MKTATKLFAGLLLASSLMVGCGANFHAQYHTSETTETTDANGNTTIATTTNNNGKVETVSCNGFKKDLVFDNQTNVTFEELECKTNVDEDYDDAFDDTLEPGYQMTCKDRTISEKVKTVDFLIEDEEGNEYEITGLNVSDLKDIENPTFEFTQNGNSISVSLIG